MPSFSLTRTIQIAASAEAVHALLNDFHNWPSWSPWEELDPTMQRTFSGSESGVGAEYSWTGNKKVGRGSMRITSATPGRVELDLDFLEPFEAHNQTVFTLTPTNGGTRVDWAMSGTRNLVMAVLGKLMFDKAIAKDFDRGLAKLKAAAEVG